MIRTQIYLTEKQRETLVKLSEKTGKKQSELIRQAINQFVERTGNTHRRHILKNAAGIWKDRTDLPDLSTLRGSWDRNKR